MPSRAYLEHLLEQARTRREADPAGVLALFERIAQAASDAGYEQVEAGAWLSYGESVSLINGRELEGLRFIRRAAEIAPEEPVAAMARLAEGEILKYCGEFDLAIEAYSHAMTLFENLADPWGECLARHALSEILVSLELAQHLDDRDVVTDGRALFRLPDDRGLRPAVRARAQRAAAPSRLPRGPQWAAAVL